jgi:hypothetical protein
MRYNSFNINDILNINQQNDEVDAEPSDDASEIDKDMDPEVEAPDDEEEPMDFQEGAVVLLTIYLGGII